MKTAIGVADHIGWAEIVTVRRTQGAFEILSRRHVVLVDAGLASAPYHHEGLKLPIAKVAPLVAKTAASTAARCREELEWQIKHYRAEGVAIQASPYAALPETLAEVLESYSLTCAADGMMYREAIADAAVALGLKVDRYPRKSDRLAAAAEALGMKKTEVGILVRAFGSQIGTPWRKEHQEAAASALALLGSG